LDFNFSSINCRTGWFVTGYLNRAKDIAQKRLDYRLKALESFLFIHNEMIEKGGMPSDNGFTQKFNQVTANFRVYGLEDEKILLDNFIKSVKNGNLDEINKIFNDLSTLVISRIRKELGII
jgi:hypothetical protein